MGSCGGVRDHEARTESARGLPAAQAVQALVESLPLELLEASRDLILDTANIKADHALSYADAFAIASAVREGACILTGDPEYQTVEDLFQVNGLERKMESLVKKHSNVSSLLRDQVT